MSTAAQSLFVMAVLAVAFSQPLYRLTAGYLLIVANLEAFRFAGDDIRITLEIVCTAIFALRVAFELAVVRHLRRTVKNLNWLFVGLFAIAVAGAVSAIYSIEPVRSWKAVCRYLTYPFVLVAVARTVEVRGPRWLTKWLVMSAVIPLICAALQVADPGMVIGDRQWSAGVLTADIGSDGAVVPRVNGTLNNANAFAQYLFVVCGWGTVFCVAAKRPSRWMYLLGLAALIAVVLTFSRGTWLCAAAVLVAWGVTNLRFRTVAPLLAIAAILTVTASYYPSIFYARFQDLSTSQNSLTWRLGVWQGIVQDAFQPTRLLTGKGLDTMTLDNSAAAGFKAHNAYLALLHDCGLPGVVALCCLLFLPLRSLIVLLRANWNDPARRSLLSFGVYLSAAFAVISITEEPLTVPTVAIYFWSVLIMCHSLRPQAMKSGLCAGSRKASPRNDSLVPRL